MITFLSRNIESIHMAKHLRISLKTLFAVLLLFSFNSILNAQNDEIALIEKYKDYTDAPREVAYVHLNKSVYIKGEDIGFTAYVLNKKSKKLSKLTTNLYVVIEDAKNNILQSKLLKVENGIASNVINVDSKFSSGYYTLKAYTNWMRNFNENNHFVESIRIIDPKTEKYIEKKRVKNNIDAQFLPEGGHLLHNVLNKVGVIIKDTKGYGVEFAECEVLDKNGNLVTNFRTNQFGIGQFLLHAKIDNNYHIKINHLNNEYNFKLEEKIENIGVSLTLTQLNDKAYITLKTNSQSLDYLKNKPYKLAVHNGNQIQVIDINFNEELSITKVFLLADLPPGINIFTLFNENSQPITERLFFNYTGIKTLKSDQISAQKNKDSLSLKINFKAINATQFNNLSISILPEGTKSYNRHHNLISYNFLQPYVNSTIENAKYYFTDITIKKQLELDNLLLTQGWSSYDWNSIFNFNYNLAYAFEQGLTLKVNTNTKNREKSTQYVLHSTTSEQPYHVELLENDTSFMLENVFFSESDEIQFSQIKKNNNLLPANLYIQSFPNAITNITDFKPTLKPKFEYTIESSLKNPIIFKNTESTQQLDEVVIKAELNEQKTRVAELSKKVFGKIHVLSDLDRQRFQSLSHYINSKTNLIANESPEAGLVIKKRIPSTINSDDTVLIYLNDVALSNAFLLYRFPMFNVDYIEFNQAGTGEGMRGGSGVIKIYTDPKISYKKNKKTTKSFELPLTFSAKKTFYVPKYQYYQDDFYEGYGVVDWKPELKIDESGNVNFKIAQPELPITLFIEGIANDGSFIFEEKTIPEN